MVREEHWESIYASTPSAELSWFAREPAISLRLIERVASNRSAGVIDIGAGASFLADRLMHAGFTDVSVLDISETALNHVQERLGERSRNLAVIHHDLATWKPDRRYDIWHDRAAFHFLTERAARDRYVEIAADAIPVGGSLVLGTFAEDGPTHCSGLPVSRYSAGDLDAAFSAHFSLVEHEREEHVTPRGVIQSFTWTVLRRA